MRNSGLWGILAGVALGAGTVGCLFAGGRGLPAAQADVGDTSRLASFERASGFAALQSMDTALAALASYASPAVVHIRSENGNRKLASGQTLIQEGQGSGVIFRPDGYIVTNDHVVGGFDSVTVILADGREFKGTVTRAKEYDIAIVKIDASGLPSLPFADSGKVQPGEISMAIGSPFGFDNSVTVGHVSALNRSPGVISNRYYPDVIQTDTPINMGNSGGPLLNVKGEIIGLNTAIFSPTGVYSGIGYAIPSNQVRMIAERLVKDGKIVRGAVGIAPSNLKPYQLKDMRIDGGAYVQEAPSNAPAAMAGIRAGDVVIRMGDHAIKSQEDLRDATLDYKPGDKVTLEYIRDGKTHTAEVKLISPTALPQPVQIGSGDGSGDGDQMTPNTPDFPNIPDFPNMPQWHRFFQNPNQGYSVPPSHGKSDKVTLGVAIGALDDTNRSAYHVPASERGVVVATVVPGSLAARLGIQPGDVIEKLDGKAVSSVDDVTKFMSGVHWGEQHSIAIGRFGNGQTSRLQLDVPFQ